MVLTFAKVPFDAVVFAGTELEVLQLEAKYGWTIKVYQQQVRFQSDYWCSIEGLTLGPFPNRGSSVLGRGGTMDVALLDLAGQLSGQEVTVFTGGRSEYQKLPRLTHTLSFTL